jgi:iron complex transport system ATP-binding protein
MGTMNAVFDIRDLSYHYADRSVLHKTSLQIEKGKLTILLGRNGSGKSTFMRLLAKIIDGYSGEIYLQEKELTHWHSKDLSRILGYLSQSHKPVFPFIVEDVILTGRAGYVHFIPTLKDTKVVEQVIEMVEIGELRKRIYTELSGGEQQLVLLARALAQKPEILLLDEPTSHLDYSNQVRILTLTKRLIENGLSIICAMHDPNMAFLYGDDFLFLHQGKILRDPGNKPWESPLLASIISDYAVVPYGEKAFVVPK